MLSERNRHKIMYVLIPFVKYEISRIGKSIDKESTLLVRN